MTRFFFDLETYSIENVSGRTDKIISIAYKNPDSEVTVLKEWESNEKSIINQFLTKIFEDPWSPELIGYNILRYDMPLIVNRATEHELRTSQDLFLAFWNSYIIDLLQCLLPSNELRFKGLRAVNVAEKISMKFTGCPSSMIKVHYENGDYEEIKKHNIEDVLFVEKLYNHLKERCFNPFNK